MAKTIDQKTLATYRFRAAIPVRWSDYDRLGHINNAKYFTYLEQARIDYFKEVSQWPWDLYSMVIAHISMDYATPILPGEQPIVCIKLTQMGTKSFRLDNLIVSDTTDEESVLYAHAETVLVSLAAQSGQAIAVPEPMRSRMLAFDQLQPAGA